MSDDGRERLLEHLRGQGVSDAEIEAAIAQDRLVLLPVERQLMGPPTLSFTDLVERGGLDAATTRDRLRSLGVTVPDDPDERAFADDDLEAVRRGAAYIGHGLDIEEGRSVTHALSGMTARMAEPLRRLFASQFLRQGDSEADLGLRFAEKAEALMPLLTADLDYLLRMHLVDDLRNDALGQTERETGALPDSYDVACAFADIVGFTALGEELPESELTDIATRLTALADEHVRPPVRIVKSIGDAVMLVSRDPDALVGAVLAITQAADGNLPDLRVGIAYGRAVPRLGDWYGPAVNLAARITGRARAGTILVTSALADALTDREPYQLSDAGHKRLKGIAEPVAVKRLRSAGSP